MAANPSGEIKGLEQPRISGLSANQEQGSGDRWRKAGPRAEEGPNLPQGRERTCSRLGCPQLVNLSIETMMPVAHLGSAAALYQTHAHSPGPLRESPTLRCSGPPGHPSKAPTAWEVLPRFNHLSQNNLSNGQTAPSLGSALWYSGLSVPTHDWSTGSNLG